MSSLGTESLKSESINVHPTAVIDPGAIVPSSCRIGPYCVIGPDVEVGENCELISHVVLSGPMRMGNHNRVFPFAALGAGPQDLTFHGEPTRIEIGDHNEIREYVTIHRGTVKGGGITSIGNHCLIMAYAHIAHDCHVGDNVIMANAATLAGHVIIEDWAVLGAMCPVHQFVRIGMHAYVGGGSTITKDVLPFSKTVAARDAKAYGLNAIGLERRGFSRERIRKIHHAYKVLLASKLNTTQALERLTSETGVGDDVEMLIRFIESSERGVIK
jgi:UDP-N-acetylglucosamine acyltransferase